MIFRHIISFFSRFIPYPNLGREVSFSDWKNKLLILILGGFVIMGFVAYVPSVFFSISEKLWDVVVVDTFIYSVVLFVAFSKRINANAKIYLSLATFYVLGISLLILLGPFGAGFNWLFVYPILAGFFYGFKGVRSTLLLNFISLSVIFFGIVFNVPGFEEVAKYGAVGWIINSFNFIAITAFISFSLAVIISNIYESLENEKKLSLKLQENKRKLLQEKKKAEEADKLKTQFLANMSHEIRTPMNSILGFSSLLAHPGQPKEVIEKYQNIIKTSGEQLMRIIDDIIDISKIESNQMKINLSVVNICSLINEVADVQRNRMQTKEKGIKIITKYSKDLEKSSIETDKIRFKQILNNLIVNAIKYSEKGDVEIGYKVTGISKKKYIEFYIKDTGRGIPKDAQKIIFDRFAQANNVQMNEGTGLGLSITQGLLELLGGKIWVESEENIGSTFYFALPFNEELSDNKNIQFSKSVKQLPDYSKKLIFIAEDDEYSFFFLQQVLLKTKAIVKHAFHGKQLLDMLASETPDLILLDINMPVLNGFDTIVEIRKYNMELPVVAQTAFAMADERKKCFDLGCNDYISKPINPEKLFKVIEPFLL